MRNKGHNNNLTGSISKGGVLYRPGEIPILTKEQRAQANLVGKLPHDFPFANWEGMNTKQQLQTMKYSGLNPQEQWSLLNANVPLRVLNDHNQTQEYAASQATPVQAPALLSAKAVQALAQNIRNASKNPSISPSLQSAVSQRKLDVQKENQQTNLLGKSVIAPANPIKITNPTKAPYRNKPVEGNLQPDDSDGDAGKKETWIDTLANTLAKWRHSVLEFFNIEKSTPEIVPIVTEPPVKTPKMTPTPRPTPSSTPTPSPTPTPTSAQRETMLDAGFDFLNDAVNDNVRYCFDTSSHNRYGKGVDPQFDCTGLAITFLSKCGSRLKFIAGYISNNCAGMVNSVRGTDYGTIMYDYKKDQDLPELQRGDFVFYADPKNLNKDVHVAVATGELLYDPIKKESYPEVIEASAVAKKVTGQYLAYNDTNEDGLYERDHSDQIITHVIQWNLEWDDKK